MAKGRTKAGLRAKTKTLKSGPSKSKSKKGVNKKVINKVRAKVKASARGAAGMDVDEPQVVAVGLRLRKPAVKVSKSGAKKKANKKAKAKATEIQASDCDNTMKE